LGALARDWLGGRFALPDFLNGVCALGRVGVCEALVQSQNGEIELLPALPPTWATGFVKGLRARDDFEVDVTWREGKLSSAVIRGAKGAVCKVRLGDKVVEVKLGRGGEVKLDAGLKS
jgi:alpha-L-fucosidase 2